MEILVGVLALGVSMWAGFLAHRANGRSLDANRLQQAIDDRAREFRDVEWTFGFAAEENEDSPPAVTVMNIGSTAAREVSVVVTIRGHRQLLSVGDVPSGATGKALLPDAPEGLVGPVGVTIFEQFGDYGFVIHWSSPLGAPDQYSKPGRQIY